MKLKYHVALLAVGLLGVLLGTLPDLTSGDLAMIPPFTHYDEGVRVLEAIEEGTSSAILNPGMQGHRAIYNILHSYDPTTIPQISGELFNTG